MRSNRAIKRLRIIECQAFSFTPPIASAKVASTNTAASSLATQQSEDKLYAGAACVKLQVDCPRVSVKIELDHGPINATSCPLWVKSGQSRSVRCRASPSFRTSADQVHSATTNCIRTSYPSYPSYPSSSKLLVPRRKRRLHEPGIEQRPLSERGRQLVGRRARRRREPLALRVPGGALHLIEHRHVPVEIGLLAEWPMAGDVEELGRSAKTADGLGEEGGNAIHVVRKHSVPDEVATEEDLRVVEQHHDVARGVAGMRNDARGPAAEIQLGLGGRIEHDGAA